MDAEVTIEQLDKSLKALVDSADALAKGGVENSGTTSDGKPAGGGQATTKDAGGIDDMMIAKMSSAGVPADTLAAFQAFMSGKPFEGKKDEGGEDEDEDEETEKSNKQKPSLAKSARQRFSDDPSIQQAVEVSPYLDALATQTAEAIDALDTSIAKSLGDITKRNDRVNFALVKSLTQVATTLRGHGEVLSALAKRLGVIEQAPARAPKGATGTASPIAKSGFGNGNGGDALTRRELCNTLTFMNLEKGLKTINGFKTSELAVAAEAGGVVAAETLEAVQRFLREHPAEADKAKAYA